MIVKRNSIVENMSKKHQFFSGFELTLKGIEIKSRYRYIYRYKNFPVALWSVVITVKVFLCWNKSVVSLFQLVLFCRPLCGTYASWKETRYLQRALPRS